jgi:RNA polymerase sigma-70 factor (ECF subfamily)
MDTDLVIRAQRGDRGAFGVLATEIAERFVVIARKILRDHDLADDATQRALVSVWRDLPQLREPDRFDAWSYRLLVRACYAEARRERRWSPDVGFRTSDEPITRDGLNAVDDRDQLEAGFRRLSVNHRAVLVLHYYLDLPLDRVAEVCGIPVGTAHSRYHHAMRGLRAALEADARTPIREVVQ